MTRAGRLLAAAAFVAASFASSAPAAALCVAVADPAGDVTGLNNAFGLTPELVANPSAPAIDIRRLSLGIDGDGVALALSLDDLSTVETYDTYSVSWQFAHLNVTLTAQYVDGAWSFSRDVVDNDGKRRDLTGAVEGSADVAGDVLAMRILRSEIGNPGEMSLLKSVRASSSTNSISANAAGAFGSDGTETVNVRLGSDCPTLQPAVEVCSVITDKPGDVSVSSLSGEWADPQVDITSIGLGSDAWVLTVRIGVSDLQAAPRDGIAYQYWSVSWRVGDASYSVGADRSSAGDTHFTFNSPSVSSSSVGVLDAARDAITILVDREALALNDGARLSDFGASSGSNSQTYLTSQWDSAPDSGTAGHYVLGAACGGDVQLCPPVTDMAGDAGPIVYSSVASIPENQPALDLLSAGGTTALDAVTVGVRVADPDAPLSAGWDAAGWTISWTKTDSERYFAQAYRSASGVAFTFGIDPSNGDSYVSGPTFGGTTTTGSIDPATGVISISVPRIAVGSPEDGARFDAFGATSWALHSGSTVAAFHVVDQAGIGSYPVGTTCGP